MATETFTLTLDNHPTVDVSVTINDTSAGIADFDPETATLQSGVTAPAGDAVVIDSVRDIAFTVSGSSFTVWDMSPWPQQSATQTVTTNFSPTWQYSGGDKPPAATYDWRNEIFYVAWGGTSTTRGYFKSFDVSDLENITELQSIQDSADNLHRDLYSMSYVRVQGYLGILRFWADGIDAWTIGSTGLTDTSPSTTHTYSSSGSIQFGMATDVDLGNSEGFWPAKWVAGIGTSSRLYIYYGNLSWSSSNQRFAISIAGRLDNSSTNGKGRYTSFSTPRISNIGSPYSISMTGKGFHLRDHSDNRTMQSTLTGTGYKHNFGGNRPDYSTSSNAGDRDVAALDGNNLAATNFFSGHLYIGSYDPDTNTYTHGSTITGLGSQWPNPSWIGFYKKALYYKGRTIHS